MKTAYLLTGKPGVGKTSLIKQLVSPLQNRAGGFYTEEIRNHGIREGFKLVTLDGQEAVLAHTGIKGPYRVSRYGVDITALDNLGVPALLKAFQEHHLVVVDEIGKMELFSTAFRDAVKKLIDSGTNLLGTIMLNTNPYADTIKRQHNVELIILTRENRAQVLTRLQDWLKDGPKL